MGKQKVSCSPLKNTFKNTTPATPLDQNQPKNFETNFLVPLQPKEGILLGALVQKYEQKHTLGHKHTHKYIERGR